MGDWRKLGSFFALEMLQAMKLLPLLVSPTCLLENIPWLRLQLRGGLVGGLQRFQVGAWLRNFMITLSAKFTTRSGFFRIRFDLPYSIEPENGCLESSHPTSQVMGKSLATAFCLHTYRDRELITLPESSSPD